MHVLIVGAGLGGLAVAQGLRNKGISYEIFDRDESEDSRFQGWAIFMHTYGSSGLWKCSNSCDFDCT